MRVIAALGALCTCLVSAGCLNPAEDDDAATTGGDSSVPVDARVPPVPPEPDASTPEPDAFVPAPDAGTGAGPVLETTMLEESTGASGEIAVTVPVTDHRSFMVVADSDTMARLSVLDITAPDGETLLRWQDWYNGDHGLTKAFFAERTATAINWPIRGEDPPLVPGDYVVRLGSYRVDGITSRPAVGLRVTTVTSRDRDLDRGLVRVAIVWAEGLDGDAALRAATDAAVDHWRDVWLGAGMDLEVRYLPSTLPTTLPYPSPMAGDLFLEASGLTEPGEVTVIVGDTIDGDVNQYGAAGRLPGPVVRSALSAIVVGWLANAGGDGEFSDADIQLYGEVLAHEVGHYLGLFHPVESSYDFWDALADTPECSNERTCEERLSTNLMFPYSICDGGTCLSTTEITGDQRGVMQRYTGAL